MLLLLLLLLLLGAGGVRRGRYQHKVTHANDTGYWITLSFLCLLRLTTAQRSPHAFMSFSIIRRWRKCPFLKSRLITYFLHRGEDGYDTFCLLLFACLTSSSWLAGHGLFSFFHTSACSIAG